MPSYVFKDGTSNEQKGEAIRAVSARHEAKVRGDSQTKKQMRKEAIIGSIATISATAVAIASAPVTAPILAIAGVGTTLATLHNTNTTESPAEKAFSDAQYHNTGVEHAANSYLDESSEPRGLHFKKPPLAPRNSNMTTVTPDSNHLGNFPDGR